MKVTILGAGSATEETATVCARCGIGVTIHADHPSAAMDVLDTVEYRLEQEDVDAGALDATTGLRAAVTDSEVIIDSAADEAAILAERFAEIESLVDRETLLTTSAPTASVSEAASEMRHPGRALGLRFHADADLVEVVGSDATATAAIERASAFVEELGATPLFVRDTPGLVSERLAAALEVEAIRLLEAGVASAATIDALLVSGYSHPVGPLERADRAGLDERLARLESLAAALGDRYEPPALLAERVSLGKTGKTAGEGFYVWEQGEPVRPAIDGPGPEFEG